MTKKSAINNSVVLKCVTNCQKCERVENNHVALQKQALYDTAITSSILEMLYQYHNLPCCYVTAILRLYRLLRCLQYGVKNNKNKKIYTSNVSLYHYRNELSLHCSVVASGHKFLPSMTFAFSDEFQIFVIFILTANFQFPHLVDFSTNRRYQLAIVLSLYNFFSWQNAGPFGVN